MLPAGRIFAPPGFLLVLTDADDERRTHMKRLRQRITAWWLAAVLAGCGCVTAQSPWADASKPPAERVSDHHGFFRSDPGAIRRIAGKIRQLEADHGFRIHVVVEPTLIHDTASGLAARLQQEWLPQGDGLVVVYEGDSRSLGIGRNVASLPDSSQRPGQVPTHEMDALLREALAATDAQLPKEEYLEVLVGHLVSGFSTFFERREATPPRAKSLRTALLILGLIALLALTAIAVGALTRLKSMSPMPMRYFPRVDRPERLGAPCGGLVVGRSFGKPPDP
jgi:hypothetical protein